MKLQRDVVIASILEYKKPFLKLLDYINSNGGIYEVPVNYYYKLYSEHVCNSDDTDKINNAEFHLSIDSLIDNGIFLKHEKNTGMLIVQSVIVDLLRYIDVNRSRELTRKDFEQMRNNLESCVKGVMCCEVGTDDYQDAMTTFNQALNSVHSKIRENAERLKIKVDELATEYKSVTTDSSTAIDSVIKLHDRVHRIYHRFVMPCFEFLNPDKELIGKENFSEAIDSLINWHKEQGEKSFNIAAKISFSKTAISSYYKDISEFERKLKQYSVTLEEDRRLFISIEAAYSRLMVDIEALRHGMRKGFKLSPEHEIFSNFNTFDGLESQKHQARLCWEEERSVRRLDEYLSYLETKELKSKRSKRLKAIPAQFNIEEERKILIAKHMNAYVLDDKTKDIHTDIESYLDYRLNDFSLVDLLYALEVFMSENQAKLQWHEVNKKKLEDEMYYLEYLPMTLKETSNV